MKIGIITIASEVFHKWIEDTFIFVIKEKISKFDGEINSHIISNDNYEISTAPDHN